MNSDTTHIPVLLQESIDLLQVADGETYIDATFGRGGHTSEILSRGGSVIAFDHDRQAIEYGHRHFVQSIEAKRLALIHENFDTLSAQVPQALHGRISGVLADFGVSSPQLDEPARGFSFQEDAPLDMRMDDRLSVRASDLVNALGMSELVLLFEKYAGEHHAKRIAQGIVTERKKGPILTTRQLADCIERVVHREGKLHPATKVFQALRIAVNDELHAIDRFLPQAFDLLAPGKRLVTIAFHEGEDRLVKEFINMLENEQKAVPCTKKPLDASQEEIERNPRSRSARVRAVQKI